MRTLKRNQRTVWFASYQSKTPVTDANGYKTGEYTMTYSNPAKLMANVSASIGNAIRSAFGVSVEYDRTIVIEKLPSSFSETSVLWVDVVPVISQSGTTNTPPDYIVTRVAEGLNGVTIAIKKTK